MAASVKIYELTATMAGTDKTSGTVRFKLADNVTVDGSNPMTIPKAGVVTIKSYHKQLRLFVATAAGSYVASPKIYSDGSLFIAGVTVNASNVGVTWAANATTAIAGATSLALWTSAAPHSLCLTKTASISAATGWFGDIVNMRMVVASNAVSGVLSAETVTFSSQKSKVVEDYINI